MNLHLSRRQRRLVRRTVDDAAGLFLDLSFRTCPRPDIITDHSSYYETSLHYNHGNHNHMKLKPETNQTLVEEQGN